MTPQQAMQAISAAATTTVDELRRIGEQNSCILAGAILTKVLHQKGYTAAYPLTVRAFILNPQLQEWVKVHGFSSDPEAERQWTALGGKGISLGATNNAPAGRWAGHLAVILHSFFDDRHAMFDLTLPQAHKSEWGINLAPMVARVPDAFVKGEREYKAGPNGVLVVYKAFPDDQSYTGYRLWTEQALHEDSVTRIVAALP